MVISSSANTDPKLDSASLSHTFKMPNPGDVFMLSAFGWAAICFFMVTVGDRLLYQLTRLTASKVTRDILVDNQSSIAAVMIIGIIGIGLSHLILVRYPKVLVGLLLFGLAFSASVWPPLHNFAFIARYLVIVYLGVYGGIFLLQNFWKILADPYYRLIMIYLSWIAIVVLAYELKIRDIWYLGTEFILMLALGIGWLSRIDNYDRLIEFNKLIAYLGVIFTVFHMLSPLVVDEAISGGRFQSYFVRATGFSTTFSFFVVALFWLSMFEERKIPKQLATAFALLGLALILLSGTRNATAATIIGVGALWWVFRTRIIVYLVALVMMGLLVQILLSGNENIEFVASRLQSTENTRLDAWALYAGLMMDSPFIGYGYKGLVDAVYGGTLVAFITQYVNVNVPGIHNYYLGLAVRFGIPALVLACCIFYMAFITSWRVIFSDFIPDREKQAYILPCALLLLVAAEGMFEDAIGSTGKGSVHGVLFGSSAYFMVVYGRRLLDQFNGSHYSKNTHTASEYLP